MLPREHVMENSDGELPPPKPQTHAYRPLSQEQDIPFLQIVTPNQMLKVPQVFQDQYKGLLERWALQCIRKSNVPYTQLVPYNFVLVLLEIAKNGDIQEYRDFIQVIMDSQNSQQDDEAPSDHDEFKSKRRTALHWACMKGHKSVVTTLCSFEDCQINAHKDTNGNMPIDLAISKGHDDIVKYIETKLKDDKLFGGSVEKYDQFWIIVGIMTILVPTAVICNFPAIFAYPLVGGCGFFIFKHLQYNYWISERNNWFLPTTLYASVMLWYMAYIMRIAPLVMAINMVPHLIVNSMAWFFFIYFIKLTKENPGSVSKHLSKQQSNQTFMECLNENRQLPLICPSCLINRPIRSKHCPTCKMCVGRFDHHCVWIGNCVGINNQALFITVLFSYVILVVSGFITVKDYFTYDANAPKLSDGYWDSFKYFYTYHTFILMYAIYGILMSFWIGKLGLAQIISIVINRTTYEQILQIREFERQQKEGSSHAHGGHGHSHGGGAECNHAHGGDASNAAGNSSTENKSIDKSFQNQHLDFAMYNRGFVNNVKEFLFDTKQFYFKFTNNQHIV
ncbi:hypothetical protein DICPUDRAFT_96619 [Dictyostelium purpureum]|uniref:Palmitoyltransferase n=1 Tax=Dictyostelium purpureum TaxID=5786 RepID=F0Z9Z4_DICPU|nr:uncharacterized protein DICPUDRAFT_96619 [Dictyostelium purpureum]EGC39237.1 hypothetical protein DICPUDRAFT_96619 [Dictyostelium purpureum]|eukprot:XP_003284264.1 hypothetical protein DICPUDRAFT_96619 [Dictyostelium purpureum]